MKRFAVFVLFLFVFQQVHAASAWAWEVQPNGAGFKVSWGGERLAKRPSAPAEKQLDPQPSKSGSRYLRIGGDPKDKNRQLGPNEKWATSTKDLWVRVDSGSGIIYQGLVPAGTEFATASTDDPTLRKAIWIRECGNDVLNSEVNAIFFRVQPESTGQQLVQAPQAAPLVQAAVAEKPPETPAPKESWLGKNWPWVLVGIAAIVGVAAAAGSGGGGGGSSSGQPPKDGPN